MNIIMFMNTKNVPVGITRDTLERMPNFASTRGRRKLRRAGKFKLYETHT